MVSLLFSQFAALYFNLEGVRGGSRSVVQYLVSSLDMQLSRWGDEKRELVALLQLFFDGMWLLVF